MTRILAIANQKGGVGKTTTSVNLAASIASKGRRVLVVDMDPQANATSGLGMPRGSVAEGIYEALTLDRPVRELTQLTEVDGLYVVPSTRELAGAEIELVAVDDREQRLKRALEPVIAQYDYVVSGDDSGCGSGEGGEGGEIRTAVLVKVDIQPGQPDQRLESVTTVTISPA